MNAFIHQPLGLIHTIFAVIALITGLIVLMKPKGTGVHKKIGYVYFTSMVALNLTAIPITNMTGSIGLFHVFIAISLPTTLMGLYVPLFQRKKKGWLMRHFSLMYWSYVGLIAAFVAEVMVRLPAILAATNEQTKDSTNNTGIMFAFAIMGVVMFVAELIFRKWRNQLNNSAV